MRHKTALVVTHLHQSSLPLVNEPTANIDSKSALLVPSSGAVTVDGGNPHSSPTLRAEMGFMGEGQQYYQDFTVNETLRFYRAAYPTWQEERCRELCAGFGLPMQAKVKRLSRGQRVQLGIVLNLSYAPKLLLLDEPTAGLDPVMRR